MADQEVFVAQQQPLADRDNGMLDGAEEDPAAAFLAQQENEIAGIENDVGVLEGREVLSAMQDPDDLGLGAVDGGVNGNIHQESNGPKDSYAAISQVDRLQSEPESIRKWREEQKERLEQLDANSRKQEAEWKEKAIKELEEWYARQDEKLQKTKASNKCVPYFSSLFLFSCLLACLLDYLLPRVADEAFYKQPFADVIGYVLELKDGHVTDSKVTPLEGVLHKHKSSLLQPRTVKAAEEAFVSDAEDIFPGTEWERVAQLCDFNPKSSKQAKDVSRMRSVLISLKQAPLVR
ncbi:Clta [Columba livia]|nr:Clta [Columba livia]